MIRIWLNVLEKCFFFTERKAGRIGRQVSAIVPSSSWCLYGNIDGWSDWACRNSWPACFCACPTIWRPERCPRSWKRPSAGPASGWPSRGRPAARATLWGIATGECATRWEMALLSLGPFSTKLKTLPVPRPLPHLPFLPLKSKFFFLNFGPIKLIYDDKYLQKSYLPSRSACGPNKEIVRHVVTMWMLDWGQPEIVAQPTACCCWKTVEVVGGPAWCWSSKPAGRSCRHKAHPPGWWVP